MVSAGAREMKEFAPNKFRSEDFLVTRSFVAESNLACAANCMSVGRGCNGWVHRHCSQIHWTIFSHDILSFLFQLLI